MVLNQPGQVFIYEPGRQLFCIGQKVVANSQSDYMGLTGRITQIIDGDDKETENPEVDIYCEFCLDAPENAVISTAVKARLNCSDENVLLDSVIMAPDMLEPKMHFQINLYGQQLYILTCFIDSDSENDDYMLCISDDTDLLKEKLHEHANQNPLLNGRAALWLHEEDTGSTYRRSFRDDTANTYVCYSIIPVECEWRKKDAQ